MNDSAPHFESEALLDNPIWNSLATRHAHLAIGAHLGHGLARRYPADIGPLSAVQEPTAEAYADLAAIVPQDDVAVLFLEHSLQIPAGWHLLRDGTLVQMICPTVPDRPSLAEAILPMKPTDFSRTGSPREPHRAGTFPRPYCQPWWVRGDSRRRPPRCNGWPTTSTHRVRGSKRGLHAR